MIPGEQSAEVVKVTSPDRVSERIVERIEPFSVPQITGEMVEAIQLGASRANSRPRLRIKRSAP